MDLYFTGGLWCLVDDGMLYVIIIGFVARQQTGSALSDNNDSNSYLTNSTLRPRRR